MCLAVYIAAAAELPIIPWEEGVTVFSTQALGADEETVLQHFRYPYVLYAGAYEGCGCGFNHGAEYPEEDGDEDDEEELRLAQKSRAELSRYVCEAVAAHGQVEIFGCWEGEQAELRSRKRIAVDALSQPTFYFEKGVLLTVVAAETGGD